MSALASAWERGRGWRWGRGGCRRRRRVRAAAGTRAVDPVGEPEALAVPDRWRQLVARAVPGVEQPRLPLVVIVRRPLRAVVEESDSAQQRLVLPVPAVIAGDAEELRLEERALQAFPRIFRAGRRPAERTAAPHVVRDDAVDADAVLRASGGVDADRLRGIALPGQVVAVLEPSVRCARSEIALEDIRRPRQLRRIAEVGGDRDPRRAGMSTPVVGALLVGVDERPLIQDLREQRTKPGPELRR